MENLYWPDGLKVEAGQVIRIEDKDKPGPHVLTKVCSAMMYPLQFSAGAWDFDHTVTRLWPPALSEREKELAAKLAAAEGRIAELTAKPLTNKERVIQWLRERGGEATWAEYFDFTEELTGDDGGWSMRTKLKEAAIVKEIPVVRLTEIDNTNTK